MATLHFLLASVHILAGAAWFGSIFYSFLFMQPRARRFFDRPGDFEHFLATLSRGTRYVALLALAAIGLSGLGLIWVRADALANPGWRLLMLGKMGLFVVLVGVFAHVSWRLWPRRVFALADELPAVRRSFFAAALLVLGLVGGNFVLGIMARLVG